jgi:hypothetical protein
MKSLRVPGRIDENDRLILDYLLDPLKPQQVEIDIILLDDDLEDYYEPTKEEILEGIREGLHDCLTGNTSPVSELWDDMMIQMTAEIDEDGQLILNEPLKEVKPQYVDVVIWFIKNKISQEQSNEAVSQNDIEVSTRELTASQK